MPHFVFAAGAAQITLEPWSASTSSGISAASTAELLGMAIQQLAEMGEDHPSATQAEALLHKMQIAG